MNTGGNIEDYNSRHQLLGDVLPDLKPKRRKQEFHVPESLIVNTCIRWLWHHGCFVWRNNTGAWKPRGGKRPIRYGKPGSPDIIGITPSGRFIGVECKSGKNKINPLQMAFQTDVLLHKGIYITAYSVDDLEAEKGRILA